jgi:c-di-GMP-binding flagellar brake protein YcgR
MPDAQIYIEKRRHKRVDKKVTVTYKVVSMPSEIEKIKSAAEKNETQTANISVGGIQLIDEAGLSPEQILRIELKLESIKSNIVTFAEVKWSAKDDNIKKYRTGIEFLVLKDEDKKMIEEIVG